MALRDDGYRIPELRKNFQTPAREFQPALDRLIRIGHAAEADRLRSPGLREQFLPKEIRRVLFDEDACLKIEACRQSKVLVIRPGIAIDAAVLAAAIGVEIHGHTDVRAV